MKAFHAAVLVVALFSSPAMAQEPVTLSLAQALDELDRHNLALAESKSRVEQARALVGQASSGLLPTVVAAGGYVRNSDEARVDLGGIFGRLGQPVPPGIPGPLTIQPLGAWNVSASARVPLVNPTGWADRSAAMHAAEATAAWAAAAAEEIVAASQRAVSVAVEHRETAARMVIAGEAAPLSVLKADTEVVRRESDLVRARAEMERARLALGVLLGREHAVRVQPSATSIALSPATEALVAEAIGRRPEIASRAESVRAAGAQALSARLRLLPQISGSASVFASDMPYPTGKRDGWRLTLDATWAIFDGGFRSSRRAEAEAEAAGAQAAADNARLAITQEVADAARDLSVAVERMRLAERQVAFAAEAAASAKRTFEGGVAGSLDVLDANDRLYQADVGLADARGRLGIANAALAKSLGRDFDR
jgi:outer membrane protein TolC